MQGTCHHRGKDTRFSTQAVMIAGLQTDWAEVLRVQRDWAEAIQGMSLVLQFHSGNTVRHFRGRHNKVRVRVRVRV